MSRLATLGAVAATVCLAACGSTNPSAPATEQSTLAMPAEASFQKSGEKDLCKDGQYANYMDPETQKVFKNQGQCVSHVNHGGTLVLVGGPLPQ